jgi:hypothetical protein
MCTCTLGYLHRAYGCTRCTVGVYMLYTRCTVGVYMVYTRCTVGVYMVYTRCTVGVYMLYTRCTVGVYMVYIRCTMGVYMVYTRYTVGVYMVYTRCTVGVYMVYTRCTMGVYMLYTRCTVGVYHDVLRTRRVDATHQKTAQAHFKAKFAVTLPATVRGGIAREVIQTRYGLVTDILRVKFGEVYVILLRADWWPFLAASIDMKTQNVVLEANRMSIELHEPFILASQIENQVVIRPRHKEHPGDRATLAVLDRSFYAHCDVLQAELA